MRRGHRSPAHRRVRIVEIGTQHIHARRGQVDRRSPVIGERGQRVVVVRRGDRDDVGQVVARWIVGRRVESVAALPAAATNNMPASPLAVIASHESLRSRAATPAVVRQPDVHAVVVPHHGRVVERRDGRRRRSRPSCAQELQAHDLDVPVDARHADRVVPDRADRAGHVRAVAVVVDRIAVVVDEVVAVDVVDVPVAVVVDRRCRRSRRGSSRCWPPDPGGCSRCRCRSRRRRRCRAADGDVPSLSRRRCRHPPCRRSARCCSAHKARGSRGHWVAWNPK